MKARVASFAFPALLLGVDSDYSFLLNQVVRGLVGMVLILVLPECKPENVQHVLKRLEGICIEVEGHNLPLAPSVGWAELLSGESAKDLLARAEAELYAHKRTKSALQSQPIASRRP